MTLRFDSLRLSFHFQMDLYRMLIHAVLLVKAARNRSRVADSGVRFPHAQLFFFSIVYQKLKALWWWIVIDHDLWFVRCVYAHGNGLWRGFWTCWMSSIQRYFFNDTNSLPISHSRVPCNLKSKDRVNVAVSSCIQTTQFLITMHFYFQM